MLAMGPLDTVGERGRVVVLSSSAHRRAPAEGIVFDDLTLSRSYTAWGAYGQSKLANLLFARWLAARFKGTGRTANAVHPGVIATNLGRHMPPLMRLAGPIANALAFKTVPEGAATQCWAAVHPAAADVRGEYLADCNVDTSSANGRDMAMADRLVRVTEEIVAKL